MNKRADTTSASPPRPVEAIYLDNHATTAPDPRVAAVIYDTLLHGYGNANSNEHRFGARAAATVETAREHVAALVNAEPDTVRFTAGSTSAIAAALEHALATHSSSGPLPVAVSRVEHRAMLNRVRALERAGHVRVSWIGVDQRARLDLGDLEHALNLGARLVCTMAANNEVGTLTPLSTILERAHAYGARVLVDATQIAGYLDLETDGSAIDYLVLSAHKLYGPQGVGALFAPRTVIGRNRDHETGTPNVPGIAGFGEAARLRTLEMHVDVPLMRARRDALERRLEQLVPDLVVNGDLEHRLPHNLHVSAPGAPNDAVTARLHDRVALSTGAACIAGTEERSHVLQAMGLSQALQESALRMALSRTTTDEEVERGAHLIADAIVATRKAINPR